MAFAPGKHPLRISDCMHGPSEDEAKLRLLCMRLAINTRIHADDWLDAQRKRKRTIRLSCNPKTYERQDFPRHLCFGSEFSLPVSFTCVTAVEA